MAVFSTSPQKAPWYRKGSVLTPNLEKEIISIKWETSSAFAALSDAKSSEREDDL